METAKISMKSCSCGNLLLVFKNRTFLNIEKELSFDILGSLSVDFLHRCLSSVSETLLS